MSTETSNIPKFDYMNVAIEVTGSRTGTVFDVQSREKQQLGVSGSGKVKLRKSFWSDSTTVGTIDHPNINSDSYTVREIWIRQDDDKEFSVSTVNQHLQVAKDQKVFVLDGSIQGRGNSANSIVSLVFGNENSDMYFSLDPLSELRGECESSGSISWREVVLFDIIRIVILFPLLALIFGFIISTILDFVSLDASIGILWSGLIGLTIFKYYKKFRARRILKKLDIWFNGLASS